MNCLVWCWKLHSNALEELLSLLSSRRFFLLLRQSHGTTLTGLELLCKSAVFSWLSTSQVLQACVISSNVPGVCVEVREQLLRVVFFKIYLLLYVSSLYLSSDTRRGNQVLLPNPQKEKIRQKLPLKFCFCWSCFLFQSSFCYQMSCQHKMLCKRRVTWQFSG